MAKKELKTIDLKSMLDLIDIPKYTKIDKFAFDVCFSECVDMINLIVDHVTSNTSKSKISEKSIEIINKNISNLYKLKSYIYESELVKQKMVFINDFMKLLSMLINANGNYTLDILTSLQRFNQMYSPKFLLDKEISEYY